MTLSNSVSMVCLSIALLAITGCGNGCQQGLTVMPSTATANHAATAPGNGQLFSAGFPESGCGAVGTLTIPGLKWTASDPSVQLSSNNIVTEETATCTAALPNPVTITVAASTGRTAQASLTCN